MVTIFDAEGVYTSKAIVVDSTLNTSPDGKMLRVNGGLKVQGNVAWPPLVERTYSAAVSESSLFTDFEATIPNVGDTRLVIGTVIDLYPASSTTKYPYFLNLCERIDATTIDLIGAKSQWTDASQSQLYENGMIPLTITSTGTRTFTGEFAIM